MFKRRKLITCAVVCKCYNHSDSDRRKAVPGGNNVMKGKRREEFCALTTH